MQSAALNHEPPLESEPHQRVSRDGGAGNVSHSARCGLILAHGAYSDVSGQLVYCDQGGTTDLHQGAVARNLVGVNIQIEDYDLQRLTDEVVFGDNGLDFDTSNLFVPELTEGL